MKNFNIIVLGVLSLLIVFLGYKYNKHNSALFVTNPSMRHIFIFYCIFGFIVIGKLCFNTIFYNKIVNKIGLTGLEGSKGERGKHGRNAYCQKE